jgi:prophage regulatory protein
MNDVPYLKTATKGQPIQPQFPPPSITSATLHALATPNGDAIIRRPDVKSLTGLSYSTIYRRVAVGEFPAPVSLTGSRAVGWRLSEVLHWIAARPSTNNLASADRRPHRRGKSNRN